MGDILTGATDYASVRRLVGMQLSRDELPDAIIADPVYLGVAEAEVIRFIPDWASNPALPMIKVATAYLTAALLVPAMPNLTSETWNGEHTYVKQPPNMLELSEKYRSMGLSYLIDIIGIEETGYEIPVLFTTGGPSRRPFFIYAPQSYDPR